MLPMDFEIGEVVYTVTDLRSRRVDRGGPESQIDMYGFVSNHTPSTAVPESPEAEFAKSLTPEETRLPFSDVDWSYISNMGFVDGSLHIQIKDDPLAINERQSKRGRLFPIYLVGSDGTKYDFSRNYQFPLRQYWEKDKNTYTEYVFENITDVAQLKGMTLVKEGYEYTETFDMGWSMADYAETIDEEWSLKDAGLSLKFKVPGEAEESLTVPVKKEMPVVNGIELYADSIVVTPLYADVTYLTDNLDTTYLDQGIGRLFRSLGIPGGVMNFYLKDDPNNANFITYDDGTVFEFELLSESFADYSYTPGMYEANVRYSKADILSESSDIIEVDRIKSITLQGVEFAVE
jgi:hypothetical protein